MEFEDMKKIWDTQNNEPLYVINQQALHHRILSKKKRAYHITNFSELLLIIVNAGAGCLVLYMTFASQPVNIYMLLLAIWMFMSALYMLVSRIRRIKSTRQFDRSMHGDLQDAISVATYQVRLSQLGRWNILPIGLLSLIGILQGGKPVWVAAVTLLFFGLTFLASRWEHGVYKNRKRELELLQRRLVSEE